MDWVPDKDNNEKFVLDIRDVSNEQREKLKDGTLCGCMGCDWPIAYTGTWLSDEIPDSLDSLFEDELNFGDAPFEGIQMIKVQTCILHYEESLNVIKDLGLDASKVHAVNEIDAGSN